MRERSATVVRGTIRVRRHCTFRWWRADRWWDDSEATRNIEIEPHHCGACIAAVEKLGRDEVEHARSARRLYFIAEAETSIGT